MKKIIELEERWKSYKYRSFIFYIFICVFVVFIAFVGLFIKNQYGKYLLKVINELEHTGKNNLD